MQKKLSMNNQHKMFLCGSVFWKNMYKNKTQTIRPTKNIYLYIKICNNNAARRTFNPHIFLYNFFIIYKQRQQQRQAWKPISCNITPLLIMHAIMCRKSFTSPNWTAFSWLSIYKKIYIFIFNCEENLLKRIQMIKRARMIFNG